MENGQSEVATKSGITAGLVTIIVLIYHEAGDDTARASLDKRIAALTHQTYENIEILLIENGNEADAVFCDELAVHYDMVRTLHFDESITIGEARNHGLDAARGEYLMFVDADDTLPSDDTIEKEVRLLSEARGDVLVGDYDRLMDGEIIHANPHGFSAETDKGSRDFRFKGFFSIGHLAYMWGKLYRTEYLREHDICVPNATYGEDKGFSMCLYASHPRYVFTDERLYIYTANIASSSYAYRADYREQWVCNAHHFEKYLTAHGGNTEYRDLISYTILFALIFHAKQEYEHPQRTLTLTQTVRAYGQDAYCAEAIADIRKKYYSDGLTQTAYRYGILGLSSLVSAGFYRLTAALLWVIFSLGVDKSHSSTGK